MLLATIKAHAFGTREHHKMEYPGMNRACVFASVTRLFLKTQTASVRRLAMGASPEMARAHARRDRALVLRVTAFYFENSNRMRYIQSHVRLFKSKENE